MSTSAGAVQLGSHTIETWSVNQPVVSLSSAESEFYAIGSGCARGLTINHVLLAILHTTAPDADAAPGMIHRVGCGRHLQTRYLQHQQALRERHFVVVRCGTKENPSDLGTKVLEKEAITSCMNKLASPCSHLEGSDRRSSGTSERRGQSVGRDRRWKLLGAGGENHECDGVDDCSVSTFMTSALAGGVARCNDAALACGHGQARRVGPAHEYRRRDAEWRLRRTIRKCTSGRLACTQHAQMREKENVSPPEYFTGH